jgi:hypothetical protein
MEASETHSGKPLLEIHGDISQKLNVFIEKRLVPNILMYGPSGSGKKHLINNFILKVYNYDRSVVKTNVMYVDCVHGKGINFIRDELKLFAKTNVNTQYFKSIILVMIDKLTLDAQSALRRCIELYNHNTRFFAIVENKSLLIRPLLSRFCDMRINYPIVDGVAVNLHEYVRVNNESVQQNARSAMEIVADEFGKYIRADVEAGAEVDASVSECVESVKCLYASGVTSLDCIWYIERHADDAWMSKYDRTLVVMHMHKIRPYVRNELLMIFMVLYMGVIRRTSIPEFIDQL